MKKVYIAYEREGDMTEALQEKIDRCAREGGGQVRLTAGIYHTATLYLKSHVELFLDSGAVIRGSADYRDYSNRCPVKRNLPEIDEWYDAIISAVDETDVKISGEGVIDGVDCQNSHGEQGFRGPHAVFFYGCRNVTVEGITLVRSACYNLMFEECEDLLIRDVSIRGGQDGFRFGDCTHAVVDHCDIRTGDDCFGGSGNRDIIIQNCMLNTPGGSTVMLSCQGLTIRNCRFWSSGYYPAVFRDDKRYSVNANALVLGYDYGYDSKEGSDDVLMEDCVLENVGTALLALRSMYDHACLPCGKVRLRGITAVGMTDPLVIEGNGHTELMIEDCLFHYATEEDACTRTLLKATGCHAVSLKNVKTNLTGDELFLNRDNESFIAENVAPIAEKIAEPVYRRYVKDRLTSLYVDKSVTEEFRGPMDYIPRFGLL